MPHVDPHSDGQRAARHPDAVIARLAERQFGTVARWQLVARGVTSSQIERRLASGHLHPIHRGVYAVGHARLSLDARRAAAILRGGPRAVLSHRTAGAVWRVRQDNRAKIDVTARTRRRSTRTVTMHEANLAPRDRATRHGLPVTSLARTLLDLAAHISEDDVLSALEQADKLDLLDARALDDVCARNRGHRGSHTLERARERYDPRHHLTKGQFERRAIELCDRLGLPRPQINARIGDDTVDLFWPEAGLIVELDSWDHHHHRGAFEDDRRRDRAMLMRGLRTMRLTWRQLEEGAGDLRQLLVPAA